jgi:hypothetical protein
LVLPVGVLAASSAPLLAMICFEHRCERSSLDLVSLVEGDHLRGLVALPAGDDPLRVGDDRPVVEEEVDVIFGGEERTDVALEYEVGLDGALDRLCHLRVGGVDQVA